MKPPFFLQTPVLAADGTVLPILFTLAEAPDLALAQEMLRIFHDEYPGRDVRLHAADELLERGGLAAVLQARQEADSHMARRLLERATENQRER